MDFFKPFIIFLLINFSALGVGSWLMGNGSSSDWYINLNKAPWTPDGWVFGAAWTTIMICFAAYLAFLYVAPIDKNAFYILFGFQLFFNMIWNLIFFKLQMPQLGLIVIISLLVIVSIFMLKYYGLLKIKSVLILPYFLWLVIATSLNAYIVFKN